MGNGFFGGCAGAKEGINMKVLTGLLLSATVSLTADAGYLGSVVQGPVPLKAETSVEMVCEDVVILYDRSEYTIIADFLFSAPRSAEEVYMYFPVDVMTPFISHLYSAMEADQLMERVDVTVDGQPVEVFPLFVDTWDHTGIPGLSWEEVAAFTVPLFPDEPESGGPFYYTRMPSAEELAGGNDYIPALGVDAVNAGWQVNFQPEDTSLVECVITGSMTTDYEETWSYMCYPLQTGSTWAGDIGRGRITAIPQTPHMEVLPIGVSMPSPENLYFAEFLPLEEIASHPAFTETELSRMSNEVIDEGTVWEFFDFEPRTASTGWRSLHPGLGDMYVSVSDSVYNWMNKYTEVRPFGWSGSFIFLYSGREMPDHLNVISVDGTPLYSSPSEESRVVVHLPYYSRLTPLEWNGGWVKTDARVHQYPAGDDEGEYTGWVRLDDSKDGLVPPVALPMLQ
ncbi:MAG: hypothetical protein GF388_00795 [Candidatus Aegiribacteria sp.]|nr:hypothetical protein [Candidatus Aegiribacteria sp.]